MAAAGNHSGLDVPTAWVVRWAPLIPLAGRVLDLACGGGRHARHLAAVGYRVEAVDRDADALARLAGCAGVTVRTANLEGGPWPCPGERFDGVVVVNYLHRPLLPRLTEALAGGGVLIYETFAAGNERFGRPANPTSFCGAANCSSGLAVVCASSPTRTSSCRSRVPPWSSGCARCGFERPAIGVTGMDG